MCDPYDDTDNGYCDKFKLQMKLEALRVSRTTTDQHGQVYVAVQYIEALERELDCSI